MPLAPQPLPGPFSRALGGILRKAIHQENATLAVVSRGVGVSEGQLSKLLNGKRRMDVDLLDDLCEFLQLDLEETIRAARGKSGGAPVPPKPRGDVNTSTRELARRVRVLVAYYPDDAFAAAHNAARRVDIELSRSVWDDVLENMIQNIPGDELLKAWSIAFGVAPDYLTSGDREYVARIEAGLELDHAMRETRTSKIAARALSKLGADEVSALAKMIREGQRGRGDEGP